MKESTVVASGRRMFIEILSESVLNVDGKAINVQVFQERNGTKLLQIGNRIYNVYYNELSQNNFEIWIGHHIFKVLLEDKHNLGLSGVASVGQIVSLLQIIRAPMPGLVTSVEVSVGDIVQIAQGIIILEAMKMENEIRSVTMGKVTDIKVTKGSRVEKDQPLLVIDPINIK